MVINDEVYYCYCEKLFEELEEVDFKGKEEKDEVKENSEVVCLWIFGIEVVNCMMGVS